MRLLTFLGVLVLNVIILAIGWAMLAFGYWLSDLVYDAGLWPIGAVMRIVLLLAAIGWLISVMGRLVGSVAVLFVRPEAPDSAHWRVERALDRPSDPIYRAMDGFFDRLTERGLSALRYRYRDDNSGSVGPLLMNLAGAADGDVDTMLAAAESADWDLERASKLLRDQPS